MNATIEKVGAVPVLTVTDTFLDATNAGELKRRLGALVESNSQVVVDLGRVDLVDSAGCGALLTCLRQASQMAVGLKLCGMTVRVREMFALFHMDRIFDLLPTRQAALQMLGL
jgi:anti-sigma B factor antagonist